MTLLLNSVQLDLRDVLRDFLTDRCGPATVRTAMDSERGYDPAVWTGLAGLGVLGLTVPDELGGAGAGHVERAVAMEELGRALAPTPFLASAVLATDALLAVADPAARQDYLPALASGELIGTVAVAEDGVWDRAGGTTTATERDGRWELDGTKSPVLAGDSAELVIVLARTAEGPRWFAVTGAAPEVARTVLTGLDPTRRYASLAFNAAPARLLEAGDPGAVYDVVVDLASVALAAEQLGGMQRAMELTVDYARIRVQFGRPIGSYQAVKHGCADMYIAWELATSVVRHAAWAADHDRAELPVAAALAQTVVGPAYFDVATAAVHYHGGIGYTWEHDAHLYYKRAKGSELLLGPPGEHSARLADRLGV